jgi:glycosyltransferase involved in cell wall biosynthesis
MVGTAQRSVGPLTAPPAGAATATPARIAVMPAYNEAPTIVAVLDDLYPRIDHLVIVDDGSEDATPSIVDAWAVGRPRVTVIHFPENRGLSAALRAGWDEVRAMLGRGEINRDDVAFSIDADGQHEPAALDGMIGHLIATGSACVIGRRDLGYHTSYKKIGNAAMTWIGRLSGGHRFEDIESGYRVFRAGPLLDAQEFYRGYKYSETVEVAVILSRLGYQVDNSYPINIPVARTRTRLYDAAVDAVCMPLAWYRLACWKDVPRHLRSRFALIFPLAVITAALIALLLMLLKPIYLGDDSAQSYAHVWYLQHALFRLHQWPWHIGQLEGGRAVMFPYGIVPWLPEALLYPLFGDWVVTASMVLGVILLAGGALYWQPRLRQPLLFALFLLNPLLWNGITQFQLTTMWAFAFFFFGAGRYERRRIVSAGVLFALAIAAHPMMGLGAMVIFTGWEWARSRCVPRRLLGVEAAAIAIASPAIFLFLSVPLLRDASHWIVALSFLDNLRRLSIPLLALLLPAVGPWILRRQVAWAGIAVAAAASALIWLPPSGLWEASQPRFNGYLAAHPIDTAATYRVLTKNNHEDGMYQLMRADAHLSGEFFTESEHREQWSDPAAYACFLSRDNVDYVLVSGEYEQPYRQREQTMLQELSAEGQATPQYSTPDGTFAYAIRPAPGACGPGIVLLSGTPLRAFAQTSCVLPRC